jgi:hypothetical protein
MDRSKLLTFVLLVTGSTAAIASLRSYSTPSPWEVPANWQDDAYPIFLRTEAELDQSLGKLTWHGSQKIPVPTVVFHTTNCKNPMDVVREGQRGKLEGNDAFFVKQVEVSPAEMRRMLAAAKPILFDLNRNRGPAPSLSFTVIRQHNGSAERADFWLANDAYPTFYQGLIEGLDPTNANSRSTLDDQCARVSSRVIASDR